MPQHDLVINNASGAAVRADLNDALAALGSTMKGPNAPPAPIAGMLWLDDDTPSATVWTLKLYDGADWLTVGTFNVSTNTFAPANALPLAGGTLTGQLLAPAGSASAPSYSFSGDPDTGFFNSGPNVLNAALNGQTALALSDGAAQVLSNAAADVALFLRNNTAGGAVDRGSVIGILNELGVAVASITSLILSNGASQVYIEATPAGSRSSDRRAPRISILGGGAINMAGPVSVTSGGQTVTGGLEASGNLRFNSGYGSAGLAFGVRGWASVTVAAGAPTMDANGNFTSITDNGVGDFTFNFTSNMPDTHYAVAGSAVGLTNTAGVQPGLAVNTANGQPLLKSTSQVRVGLYRLDANSYADAATFSIMVVR